MSLISNEFSSTQSETDSENDIKNDIIYFKSDDVESDDVENHLKTNKKISYIDIIREYNIDKHSFDLFENTDDLYSFINMYGADFINEMNILSSITSHDDIINLTNTIGDKNISIIPYSKKKYHKCHKYFENIYIRANSKYLVKSHISSLDDIKKDTNLANTDSVTQSNPAKQLKKTIKRIEKNKPAQLVNKPVAPPVQINESNFWSEIKKLNYKDKDTMPSITQWKANKATLKLIVENSIYKNKFIQLTSLLIEILSDEVLEDTGIIHHIIFSGQQLFDYIVNSPDFVLYIINENSYHNIPKYLES